MSVDSLALWKSSFKAQVPPTRGSDGAKNISDWADSMVTNKLVCQIIQGPNIVYTFSKAIFKAQLEALTPTNNVEEGVTNFANSWASAITSTTAVMGVGSSIGAPSNATTWSSITTTTLDTPSKTAGVNKLKELKDSPSVSDAANSELPLKMRDAFLLHTITTVGLDSTPPAVGPLPLTDAVRAVS